MINKRRTTISTETLETAQGGFANGISTQLKELISLGQHRSLTEDEKRLIIDEASTHYGKFLTALGVDWENDPNSMETPKRVAKAYVNDLWKGRYELMNDVTSFPSDGYKGCITQTNIHLSSMCSHHHLLIAGRVHISYLPGDGGQVIGLSKLNRIVDHFSRRGAIQEQLTEAIHNAVNVVCVNNIGVAVCIVADHACVSCRGVGHQGSAMITTKLSGNFEKMEVRQEFFKSIELASLKKNY
jgi:GTP cyclohydrolase I